MIGWIKLHRKITEHWVWSKPEYFQWWIDILLQANYESKTVLIKNQLLECKRGDVLYSLETWSKRWNTNKSKANRFLKMLEKDKMVCIKNETVTTRITICKYDSYQDVRNDSETQVEQKRNADETQVKPTKEEKEIEEGNNNGKSLQTGKFIFPDQKEDSLVEKTTKEIAKFFSISEMNQAKHFIQIGNFVRCMEGKGKLKYLIDQFNAYRKIKKDAPMKYIHKWHNYIGDPEESYEDGSWNKENWLELLNKSENEDSKTLPARRQKIRNV